MKKYDYVIVNEGTDRAYNNKDAYYNDINTIKEDNLKLQGYTICDEELINEFDIELKEGSIFDISWPRYDETALVKDEVEIVVQINGKVRGKLSIAANISREEMEKVAMEDEKIKVLVEGKTIVKVVAVPKKLVNIVVK